MGIRGTVGNSQPRETIPAGNYVARCYRMIHIGTNYDQMWDKNKDEVRITWELPTETRVFDEAKGEQPMVIDGRYTLSMHEKSNLRGMLESWRGLKFTDAEAEEFDITKLVGVPCMLNVIHNTKGDKTYANIGSVSPVPKGLPIPQEYNKPIIFDYENNFDTEFVETLPDFIKDPLKSSIEYKDRMLQLEGAAHDKQMDAATANDPEPIAGNDDLPFIITILLSVGSIASMLI